MALSEGALIYSSTTSLVSRASDFARALAAAPRRATIDSRRQTLLFVCQFHHIAQQTDKTMISESICFSFIYFPSPSSITPSFLLAFQTY